jgi:hypothetical protein
MSESFVDISAGVLIRVAIAIASIQDLGHYPSPLTKVTLGPGMVRERLQSRGKGESANCLPSAKEITFPLSSSAAAASATFRQVKENERKEKRREASVDARSLSFSLSLFFPSLFRPASRKSNSRLSRTGQGFQILFTYSLANMVNMIIPCLS